MRSFPGWQPLDEPQAVLPTAPDLPDDAALAARRIDALIVGVLTIGPGTQATSGSELEHRWYGDLANTFVLSDMKAMELGMRSVPGWRPLDGLKAVLPTALDLPDDASLAARRMDALIVGVITIGRRGGPRSRRRACEVWTVRTLASLWSSMTHRLISCVSISSLSSERTRGLWRSRCTIRRPIGASSSARQFLS